MVLDKDVLIALEKQDVRAQAWFGTLLQAPFVAGYAALELLQDCENNADRKRIERALQPFDLLWPDDVSRNKAVQDFGALRLQFGLGAIDMLIAITALQHGETLVTFNTRHFRGVPSLSTLQPYVR
jgi:predicted nucleic acid-binding protein